MIKASIITIGDELLIGQVIDTNAAWIAQRLNDLGIEIVAKYSVGDDKKSMVDVLTHVSQESDIVLMTGGLGPTKDDITKTALIEFFDDTLSFSEETYSKLTRMFESRGKSPGPAHKTQCELPSKATLFQNPLGTAPGMMLEKDGLRLFSMPGVPYEMKALMTQLILPYIQENYKSDVIIHKTIMTGGVGESTLAEIIEDIENGLPEFIKLAYLPSLGYVRLRLSAKGKDKDILKSQIEMYTSMITDRLGDKIWGYDDESIVSVISEICADKNLKIGTAESCTGGNISKTIVNEPGSSSFFAGGVVVYSNAMKKQLLKVSAETLSANGAVSKEVVEEMAIGAINSLDVDVALSVSGIAGPDGGTEEKPVGTIWLCVSDGQKTEAKLIKGFNKRENNIQYATKIGLLMLLNFIKSK